MAVRDLFFLVARVPQARFVSPGHRGADVPAFLILFWGVFLAPPLLAMVRGQWPFSFL